MSGSGRLQSFKLKLGGALRVCQVVGSWFKGLYEPQSILGCKEFCMRWTVEQSQFRHKAHVKRRDHPKSDTRNLASISLYTVF